MTSGASPALAQAPVKMKNFTGSVDVSATGPTPLALEGTASHLGRFTGRGEVEFTPTGLGGSCSARASSCSKPPMAICWSEQ